MQNRKMKSALVVAGAAAGAAAATWLGKRARHLAAVDTSREAMRAAMVEPESAELPIGRSADPELDESLSRNMLPQDATSGASLLGDVEPFSDRRRDLDLALDDVWSASPGLGEPEQTESYDAVDPEDLGSVWIARATQTAHEHRPAASEAQDVPELSDLISQGTRDAARAADEADLDEDPIADDALDERS